MLLQKRPVWGTPAPHSSRRDARLFEESHHCLPSCQVAPPTCRGCNMEGGDRKARAFFVSCIPGNHNDLFSSGLFYSKLRLWWLFYGRRNPNLHPIPYSSDGWFVWVVLILLKRGRSLPRPQCTLSRQKSPLTVDAKNLVTMQITNSVMVHIFSFLLW